MRRVVYQGMLSLPAKSISGLATVVGLAGTIWPEKVQARAHLAMTPENIRVVGIALLVAAVGYFFLLWWLKPGEAGEGSGGQHTTGPLSPAIRNIGRDAHFHYGPPPAEARQERRSPYGSGYDIRSLTEGMEAVLRGAHSTQPPPRDVSTDEWIEGLRGTPPLPSDKPLPNMALAGVLQRVYAALGPSPQGNLERGKFWLRIDQTIADAVVEHDLHTWGRAMAGQARRPITTEQWQTGLFNHKDMSLEIAGFYTQGYKMTDLYFCKAEIDRVWPEKPRTTNNGND